MKKYLVFISIMTMSFILASCYDIDVIDLGSDNSGLTNYIQADSTDQIILANGTKPEDWKMNSYSLISAYINGDTLFTKVVYGGGCEVHEIKLVAWNYFLESHPVQAKLLISHDSRGDACKALITHENKFDLSPLKYEFQGAYNSGSGTIILNILLSDGQSRTFEYTFWPIR